jgi:hypothetical protein
LDTLHRFVRYIWCKWHFVSACTPFFKLLCIWLYNHHCFSWMRAETLNLFSAMLFQITVQKICGVFMKMRLVSSYYSKHCFWLTCSKLKFASW